MVRLLLYAYCVGKPSSRQIEKAAYDEVAFRYLAAGAGYFSEEALGAEILRGMDELAPPDSPAPRKQGEPRARNAPRSERAEAMRARFNHPAERANYDRRKATVEPGFGQVKERRRLRRFPLRGLAKGKADWALICLTHNLLKLHQQEKTKAEGTSKAVRANRGKARRSQQASWNPHNCRTAA